MRRLRLWIKAAETAEAPSARAEADKDAEIAALRRGVRELGVHHDART
ncbi:hypothetical protein [Streptomyces sp. NPDC056938]